MMRGFIRKVVLSVALVLFFVVFTGVVLRVRGSFAFRVEGENKVGLRLTSKKNLVSYVTRIKKNESTPWLQINFYDYVPKELKMYRRLEPVYSSPIVLGCGWEKKTLYWRLSIYGDVRYMSSLTEKEINMVIGACTSRLYNSQVTDTNRYQQLQTDQIDALNLVNGGVIFEK